MHPNAMAVRIKPDRRSVLCVACASELMARLHFSVSVLLGLVAACVVAVGFECDIEEEKHYSFTRRTVPHLLAGLSATLADSATETTWENYVIPRDQTGLLRSGALREPAAVGRAVSDAGIRHLRPDRIRTLCRPSPLAPSVGLRQRAMIRIRGATFGERSRSARPCSARQGGALSGTYGIPPCAGRCRARRQWL